MHRRTRPPIRLVTGLALGAALTIAGCGDDDGGGSTEEFCEQISTLADSGGDTTEEEDFAAIQAIADVAPDEISDDMDQVVDAFEQFQSFDPESASEDEMAEFVELAASIDEAGTRVEEFSIENCPGLPDGVFNTD